MDLRDDDKLGAHVSAEGGAQNAPARARKIQIVVVAWVLSGGSLSDLPPEHRCQRPIVALQGIHPASAAAGDMEQIAGAEAGIKTRAARENGRRRGPTAEARGEARS